VRTSNLQRVVKSCHTDLYLRILAQIIPEEELDDVLEVADERSSKYTHRPSFSLPVMTNNFRRFNARYWFPAYWEYS
jgi:hypothetical protein